MFQAEIVADIYDIEGVLVKSDATQGREYDSWQHSDPVVAAQCMINHCGLLTSLDERQLRNPRLRIKRCKEVPVSLEGYGGYWGSEVLDDYSEHASELLMPPECWGGLLASEEAKQDLAERLNATMTAWADDHQITTDIWRATGIAVLELPLIMVEVRRDRAVYVRERVRRYDLELDHESQIQLALLGGRPPNSL